MFVTAGGVAASHLLLKLNIFIFYWKSRFS